MGWHPYGYETTGNVFKICLGTYGREGMGGIFYLVVSLRYAAGKSSTANLKAAGAAQELAGAALHPLETDLVVGVGRTSVSIGGSLSSVIAVVMGVAGPTDSRTLHIWQC